jgi:hypothetical protein
MNRAQGNKVRVTRHGTSAMTPDERIKAFIEILRIVVWPAAVIWLVWYLRDEVKRASTRIIEIGLTGAKFAPPPEQTPTLPTGGVSTIPRDLQSGSPAIAAAPDVQSGNLSGSGSSGLQQFVSDVSAFISKGQLDPGVQTTRSELATKIGPNPKDQFEALLYLSAALNVQLSHEKNYNVIFGSQLQLLAQMNVDVGVQPSVAKAIYDAAKAAHPEVYRAYTFEQWIAFLQGGGLIIIAPSGNYVLTHYGRGFLKYILDRRLSVNRPF